MLSTAKLTPATHAQETCTRNWYRRLVQKLAHVLVNLVQVFFWYKFLERVSPALHSWNDL